MKQLFIAAIILHSLIMGNAGYAQKQPEEILKAVVKVRAVIPDSALTAPLLGTEREGNGILIDSDGYILTIGYLILEAGRPLKCSTLKTRSLKQNLSPMIMTPVSA